MGHSSFAYIVEYDGTVAGMHAAFERLRAGPPRTGPDSFTDMEGYTIQDAAGARVAERPAGIRPVRMEHLARAILRNLTASSKRPPGDWKPHEWDDREARELFFGHAGKWEPAVLMPIDGRRLFVFGMTGG